MRPRVAALLVLASVAATPRVAQSADVKLDGRWRQGPMREDYTVQQWLETGCGPAPQSTTVGGAEIVQVRTEGDDLAFIGGGRVFRTNQCYDAMPTLGRQSHSRDPSGKSWRTQCTTPAKDPRRATLNTLVVATTEAHIDIVETGRYEINLENGRCMADVKRTRSFTLVRDDEPAPTPNATAAPKPTAKTPESARAVCTTPGEATKLEVRPSKKLIRTGEAFKFRGLVVDANGCETHTTPTWRLATEAAGKGITVDGTGRVSVGSDAPEGTAEIIVTAAGKDARVVVEVVSPARYDELLARSGLNAAGENDEASTVTIASQSLGVGEGRVEDRSRERRMLFLAIIGGVLVVLGAATVLLIRRSRRAKALLQEAEDRHEARVQQVLDRRRLREEEHAAQMRAHEESVAAARAASARGVTAAKSRPDMVCPTCGRQQGPDTSFCPHDGTPLEPKAKDVPAAVAAGVLQRSASGRRGKICPTCGERFEGGAEFCGKDGTVLVLLN